MTVVLVQLDGVDRPLALQDTSWEHVAPCGCTTGAMVVTTADQDAAFREFIPNAELRRRDAAAGFVFRLAEREGVMDRLQTRCTHEPRYGVEKVALPDGFHWGYARGQSRLHLVPATPDEHGSFQYWGKHVHSASRLNDWWRHGYLGDQPTCRSCEKWARTQAAEVAS